MTVKGRQLDIEWLYKIAVVVISGLILAVAANMWTTLAKIEARLDKMEITLVGSYVTREEFMVRLERLEDRMADTKRRRFQ